MTTFQIGDKILLNAHVLTLVIEVFLAQFFPQAGREESRDASQSFWDYGRTRQ